jgi:uncharacterized protein YcgL (UPF0745 family)
MLRSICKGYKGILIPINPKSDERHKSTKLKIALYKAFRKKIQYFYVKNNETRVPNTL